MARGGETHAGLGEVRLVIVDRRIAELELWRQVQVTRWTMTVKGLEQRVRALERQVLRLQEEVAAGNGAQPDWKRAVEQCRGDEDLLAVIREGIKVREKDRQAARKKYGKS